MVRFAVFDQDSQNPGDTGWAYANALLGNYTAFTQVSKYEVANYRYQQIEWYTQDTWKARSNLTLNYGVRLSIMGPLYEENNLVPASFLRHLRGQHQQRLAATGR